MAESVLKYISGENAPAIPFPQVLQIFGTVLLLPRVGEKGRKSSWGPCSTGRARPIRKAPHSLGAASSLDSEQQKGYPDQAQMSTALQLVLLMIQSLGAKGTQTLLGTRTSCSVGKIR